MAISGSSFICAINVFFLLNYRTSKCKFIIQEREPYHEYDLIAIRSCSKEKVTKGKRKRNPLGERLELILELSKFLVKVKLME